MEGGGCGRFLFSFLYRFHRRISVIGNDWEKGKFLDQIPLLSVCTAWGRLADRWHVLLEWNQMAANQCVACRIFCNLEIKEILHFSLWGFLERDSVGKEDESSLHLLKNEHLSLQLNIKYIQCMDRVLYFSCMHNLLYLHSFLKNGRLRSVDVRGEI